MFTHKKGLNNSSPTSLTPGTTTPPSRVPSPFKQTVNSLRPYVKAILAFPQTRKFHTQPSVHRTRQRSALVDKEGKFEAALTVSDYSLCRMMNS